MNSIIPAMPPARKLIYLVRPFARAAAEIGGGLRGAGARRLAAARRARPPPACAPGSAITSAPRRALAALGGRRRERSGRDEFADREPASDDGELFQARPASATACSSRNRAFPSDRYAVVSQLEFHGLDAARASDRGRAAPGRAHAAHRGSHRRASSARGRGWRWCCCPACNISPASCFDLAAA